MATAIFNTPPTWQDLEDVTVPHPVDRTGTMAQGLFPNGYGFSVVRFRGSYGDRDGLYELGVLHGTDGRDWSLDYDNPVANGDVVGYLTESRVVELIAQIFSFPRKGASNS